MSWRPVRRSALPHLQAWLKEDEWRHASLSSRIRHADAPPCFGRIADGRMWTLETSGGTAGVLHFSRYGVVLPSVKPGCSIEQNPDDRETLRRILSLRRDKLFSIIGESQVVERVESLVDGTPADSENYRLFSRDDVPEAVPPPMEGLECRRAGVEDLEKLWPLERDYQLEEVIRPGSYLDERFSRLHFRKTLREQLVYYAVLNGKPVAKAGTNARGWRYDQIGGVFVEPNLRNRGLGRFVMHALLKDIHSQGRNPTLFVKLTNPAARALYSGLGFDDKGGFRISYWNGSG